MLFQSKTAERTGGPISAFKAVLPAAVLAFGLATASGAGASTYIMDVGSMDNPRVVNISGVGNVYAAPMLFDGNVDGSPFIDLVAFCVDVYHQITLANYSPDLVYTDTVPLTTDSRPTGATLLTLAKIDQIGRLVHYGSDVFYQAPKVTNAQKNARWDELAAVQGAIWEVASGKNVTSSNATLDGRISSLSGANYLNFIGAYGAQGKDITFLTPLNYPSASGTQSFATAAVPEPATWAMMILGFGAIGAFLRRRAPAFA